MLINFVDATNVTASFGAGDDPNLLVGKLYVT